MRLHRLYAVLLVAAAHLAAATAADHPDVIRFGVPGVGLDGYSPVVGGLVGSVASKGVLEDEFKKDGIRVEWTFFKGAGPGLNESLANGLLDFAVGLGDLPASVHRSGGLKTQILLGTARLGVSYLVVPADSQARTLADLKGKRIAVFKGTASQLTLNRILEAEGFTERDFKVINFDGATARGAIATKDIDGYLAGSDAFNLVARGVGRILYSTRGRSPTLVSTTALVVTDGFEKRWPDLVQRAVSGIVKEAAWSSDESHRADVLKLWAKSGLAYNFYKEDFGQDPLAYRNSPLLDEFFIQHYVDAREQSKAYKLIRKDYDVASWFNRTYLDRAIKEQGLEDYFPEFDAKGKVAKEGRAVAQREAR